MAAIDYEIVLGMASAYFAKKKKKPTNTMSTDRRPISEGEVMMLVDFYLKNHCLKSEDCMGIEFKSHMWPGMKVKMEFVRDVEDDPLQL